MDRITQLKNLQDLFAELVDVAKQVQVNKCLSEVNSAKFLRTNLFFWVLKTLCDSKSCDTYLEVNKPVNSRLNTEIIYEKVDSKVSQVLHSKHYRRSCL